MQKEDFERSGKRKKSIHQTPKGSAENAEKSAPKQSGEKNPQETTINADIQALQKTESERKIIQIRKNVAQIILPFLNKFDPKEVLRSPLPSARLFF